MPPSLTEQLDTLYTTTWQKMQNQSVDNIYNARPFWWWLNKNGRREEQTGGKWIGVTLNYVTNNTVRGIGRYGTIAMEQPEHLTMAQYFWRYVAGSVQRGFIDDQQNSGEFEIIDRVQNALDNLVLSMQQKMGEYVFGDGSADGGTVPEGLDKHVSVAPTLAAATLGGIDPSVYTWWRNQQMAASGAMDVFLVADMRKMHRIVSDGVDFPDLILTTADIFEGYEAELLEFYRITDRSGQDLGFENYKFKGATIFWDAQVPAGRMYFLNTKYFKLKYDPRVNFAMTEWKQIPNQLDRVAQIVWAGNLCTTQRRRQGVITGIA